MSTADSLAATAVAHCVVTAEEIAAYRDVVRSAARDPAASAGTVPGPAPASPGGAVASPIHPFVLAWNTFDEFVGTVTAPPGERYVQPSVLHLSQEIRQHRPLRADERVTHELDVLGVRHESRGVRLSLRSTLVGDDGVAFAELVTGLLALGASAPAPYGAVPAHPPHASKTWDTVVALTVPADLPARYAAVSGDANPIHLDHREAVAAGFDGVIAHGMSVVALVSEVVVERFADGDAARVRSLGCRFSAPVVPGETVDVCLQPDDDGALVRFVCRTARGPALKSGWVELAADGEVADAG